MINKYSEEKIFQFLMKLSTFLVLASLSSVVIAVIIKGLPSLTWEVISQAPKGGFYMGKSGGVLNAILGSIYLSFGATLLSIAVSLPVVLYLNVYLSPQSKIATTVRIAMDVLWGVPSIVYGAFGFSIMMFCGFKTSLLVGIVILAIMILPIIIRAMDEIVKNVPKGLLDASYALGATRWETAFKIVVKQTLPGITTAILLGFGRSIGDAASVIFTAGYTDRLPSSLLKPVASLPLAIFFQLGAPIKEVQNRAYASAVILTMIILLVSIASRLLYKRYAKNQIL
jgi:phosphate transport system permease protein